MLRARRGIPSVLAVSVVAASILVLVAHANRPASAATALLPNIKALPASQLSLSTGFTTTYLRLSATTWNNGAGPLELRGGLIEAGNKQRVDQRVYQSDGTFIDYNAGSFAYHPEHQHTHFEDYATYTLDSLTAPGSSQRSSTKTTFCIIDTTAVNLALPGAPGGPVYTTCGSAEQGMSVGWGDTYPYTLPGQLIDVTGLPDGDYTLTIEADPKGRIIESNEGDNTSTIVVRLSGGTVSVVPSTPTPTPTATITPTPTPTRTPTPCPMVEDLNGDGAVAFADLLLLAKAYNSTPDDANWNPLADFNSSGAVAFDDLLLMALRYNIQCVP